ncbi:MAG: DUF502 domain-containing protein [Gammaproteobacteria bacterium]|jgi:uncharacterized membrane protein|nr:DUF502 domain-containing protein [Gammaproteobacteria bacterium]
MLTLLKTTCLGGIIFLVPIVLFIAVLDQALTIVASLAAPIAAVFPVSSIGDLAIVHIVALLILVFVCFLAGLAARTAIAGRVVQSLEANILDKIPAYALMKMKAGTMLSVEDAGNMVPVLIQFDDYWQMGFEVEKLDEEKSLVFLPGAPDPWSGSVRLVLSDRITPLDTNITAVTIMMKALGKGSSRALRTPAAVV